MKTKKATAFWTTQVTLVLLYVLTLILGRELLASVGVTIVIMLVGNAATYVGGAVADAWQKSKYFRAELDGK